MTWSIAQLSLQVIPMPAMDLTRLNHPRPLEWFLDRPQRKVQGKVEHAFHTPSLLNDRVRVPLLTASFTAGEVNGALTSKSAWERPSHTYDN